MSAARVTVWLCAIAVTGAITVTVVVASLGHAPSSREYRWIGIVFGVACLSAVLAVPLRRWFQGLTLPIGPPRRHERGTTVELLADLQGRGAGFEEVLLELARALRASLGSEAAEWWLGSSDVYRRAAASPSAPEHSIILDARQQQMLARTTLLSPHWVSIIVPELPSASTSLVAPIATGDELVGFLVLNRPAHGGLELPDDVEQDLTQLCARIAPMMRNAQLDHALRESLAQVTRHAAALEASRARIVAAGDTERRRIERNLHDGLQEQLVAISLGLRLARELHTSQPAEAKKILERLENDVGSALEELRALAQGIYPPTLQNHGLEAILRVAAQRASLPTLVSVELDRRPPREIEATIYFCCVEAIHNACKYAGPGATVRVDVTRTEDAVRFQIVDNGTGFTGEHRSGTGLLNIEDRVGAQRGTVLIESAPGKGVSILGILPLETAARSVG